MNSARPKSSVSQERRCKRYGNLKFLLRNFALRRAVCGDDSLTIHRGSNLKVRRNPLRRR